MGRKRSAVTPQPISQDLPERKLALRLLASEATFKPASYEFDDTFKPGDVNKFGSVHTIPELMASIGAKDSKIEAEGIFLEADKHGQYRYIRLKNKNEIQETWKRNIKLKRFREANTFAGPGDNAGLVGDDFVPLLGGPFNKQPYLYDYLRAHAYAFHEYHHHPFARAVIHITRDFVLGRGYRVDSDDQEALALWSAFEKVNNLEEMMEDIVKEGATYGENLIWWLPNSEVNIGYQDRPGQEPKQGLIPRIRMIDPSTCWEIVTFPEDIKRVLYYQLVFPTQYQIYTGSYAGAPVPTSKFIMQQLPADSVMHFKYNCMSNEKRGRSDLFPILGYLKWVRDCVNYKLIALKKQSAWTEDISVEGSQADIDNLAQSLQSLGEFEPAGSRFIHTDKITRNYLNTPMSGGGKDETLEWGINMIAAGSQIPVSYFGLAQSAGSTRAGAVVGTEPVAKKMERRQREVGRLLEALWRRFQDNYGKKGTECTVTFPEIITQDRTAKIKDIKFSEDSEYICHNRAATMAAKELDADNYDPYDEMQKILQEHPQPISPTLIAPLTAPAAVGAQGSVPTAQSPASPNISNGSSPSAVTGTDRRAIKTQDGSSNA